MAPGSAVGPLKPGKVWGELFLLYPFEPEITTLKLSVKR